MTGLPRVLDVSSGVGDGFAGRLLADAGWDVVHVVPPGGDPLARQPSRWGGGEGGAHAVVSLGKRAVAAPSSDLLWRLAAAADVVVGDLGPQGTAAAGLPGDAHDRLRPRLATVSVSPFGRTGPKAGWASSELVMQAASGLLFLTGEWDRPPSQLAPYQAQLIGGAAGAAAAVAATMAARREGRARDVDVAMVEALAGHGYESVNAYADLGEVHRREPRVKAGLRMVPTSDGFVYCAPSALSLMRMDGIAELVGEPALAEERFQTAEGRAEHWDEFVALFVPPFSRRTAREWFAAAEERHMTFALVQSIDELLRCEHMAARGAFVDAPGPDGATVRVPGRPWRLAGEDAPPAPPPTAREVDPADLLAEWGASATA